MKKARRQPSSSRAASSNLNEIEVRLPTPHADQVLAWNVKGKYKAIRCGRRWGKTEFGKMAACGSVIPGQSIGWFSPDYKIQSEAFNEMADALAPVMSGSNKNEGVIRTITDGRIDFWSLENERAGRSRRYHGVIIDEAAFTKANMMDIWERSIQPTLLDFDGWCLVLSNTNGVESDNFFYQICTDPKHGFVEYHAPTTSNPLLPLRRPRETDEEWNIRRDAMIAKLISDHHPLVYKQEYLAEFVDWSGVAFFSMEKLLANGLPVDLPIGCEYVFAVIDSATKTGKENDGTAVCYFAYERHPWPRVTILDWDIQQIEGSMLEYWLPGVIRRCDELANDCRSRMGAAGVWIEDKNSGSVLIQQSQRRQLKVYAIDSKLTAMGKQERALSISGYVFRDLVKLSRFAYDKTVNYKGSTRNHFVSQVTGFRMGNKDQVDDDALDTFCYGVAISLGDGAGW